MNDKVREALEAVIHDAFWDLTPKDSAFVLLRIKEALAALEDDGWVRCSDWLPLTSGYYLVYHPLMRRTHVAWFNANTHRFESPKNYVYWQPLPPPPTEEGAET